MGRRRLPRNDAILLDQETLLEAEVAYDATHKRVRFGDGTTPGGVELGVYIPVASQAEAAAGLDNTKRMTPLRTAQAIAALAPGGGGSADINLPFDLRLVAEGVGTGGDDTAAFNMAINECFGSTRHTSATAYLNRPLYIPPANYNLTDEINAHQLYGWEIFGGGRLATNIIQHTAGKRIFNLDGCAFGEMRSLTLMAEPGVAAGPLLDLDWTGTYAGLKPQQLTFADLLIDGGNAAQVGFHIAKSGGGAQSDTIKLDNCFIESCRSSGLQIGTPSFFAQNALSIIILGGNIQGCTHDGIANYGGSVFVDGTSEQPQTDGTFRQQRTGGFFLRCLGNTIPSTLKNVRSEGSRLCGGSGPIYAEKCQAVGEFPSWSASTAFPRGAFVIGRYTDDGGTPLGTSDGRVFVNVCSTSTGTTSGTEPTWKSAPTHGRQFGFLGPMPSLTVGQTVITPPGAASYFPVGTGLWIAGAGAAGADLFTTVTANDGTHITIADAVGTAVTTPVFRHNTVIVDGGAKWMLWEFVSAECLSAVELDLFGGQINAPSVERCTFSRSDARGSDSGELYHWQNNFDGQGVVVYRGPALILAVADLPPASAQNAGAGLKVRDANATTFNSVVAGGGTYTVPVFSDGTNWRIG